MATAKKAAAKPAKKAAAKAPAPSQDKQKLENEPKAPKAEKPKKREDLNTVDEDFVYPHEADPRRSLPGGVYLDQVQREKAEIARAKAEGREPDLDNPPAAAGTPLVSKKQFLNAGGSYFPNAADLPVTTQPVVKD